MTQFRIHASGDYSADTSATGDARTLEEHRGPVGNARVGFYGNDRFVDRCRLARKRGFVRVEV